MSVCEVVLQKLISTQFSVCRKGHYGLAKYFLESGADPGAATRQGETPLHAAAARGHLFVVELLLRLVNCYTTAWGVNLLRRFCYVLR